MLQDPSKRLYKEFQNCDCKGRNHLYALCIPDSLRLRIFDEYLYPIITCVFTVYTYFTCTVRILLSRKLLYTNPFYSVFITYTYLMILSFLSVGKSLTKSLRFVVKECCIIKTTIYKKVLMIFFPLKYHIFDCLLDNKINLTFQ